MSVAVGIGMFNDMMNKELERNSTMMQNLENQYDRFPRILECVDVCC